MKGVVEIYGTDDQGSRSLIAKKDNLTMIGFSEQITDLLTTPSSMQFPTAENANILDSSNYTVQAFSMSKNIEHFSKNQHVYNTSNLLHHSRLDSSSGWSSLPNSSSISLTKNSVLGYTSGVSGTLVTSNSSSSEFSQRVWYDGRSGGFSSGIFSGTCMVGSVDIKFNRDNPPAQVSSVGDSYIGQSTIQVGVGGASAMTIVLWNSSGGASLQDPGVTDAWEGGIKTLGGGWYRVFLSTQDSTTTGFSNISVFPSVGSSPFTSYGSLSAVDGKAGSIFIARPQLELGRVPTNYVETSSFLSPRDETAAYSLLNNTSPYGFTTSAAYNYYVLSGAGGLSLSSVYGTDSTDKGVSAYIPATTFTTPAASPDDRELTKGARTPVEKALDIEFIQGQIPNSMSLSANIQLSTYNTKWSYTSAYSSYIGRHVAYLGAYSVNDASAGANINFVSALTVEGYANPLLTHLIGKGVDGQCADRFGYWELKADGAHTQSFGSTDSDITSTVEPSFSSTGEITYYLRLRNQAAGVQRDAPMLNIFGGVDTLGLWGIDLKAIREYDITSNPPYTRGATVDPHTLPIRRYKLFNKLVLTDNIVKHEGKDTTYGIVGNYANIEIYWKVKFL